MNRLLAFLPVLILACSTAPLAPELGFAGGKGDAVAEGLLHDTYAARVDSIFAVCRRDLEDEDGDGDGVECSPSAGPQYFAMSTLALVELGSQSGSELDESGMLATFRACRVDIEDYDGIELRISDDGLRVRETSMTFRIGDEGGVLTMATGLGVLLFGVDLLDPDGEALPTSNRDHRLADDDDDGRAGISVRARKDSISASIYAALRLRVALRGEVHPDRVVTGDADLGIEMSVVGDSSIFFNAREDWEETQAERGIADESHTLTMLPISTGSDCDAVIAAVATPSPG